jgi:PTH2 family peptidyl-tRNA hydrolase
MRERGWLKQQMQNAADMVQSLPPWMRGGERTSLPVKQVIAVRNDLNMRKGKFGGQVAHASSAFLEEIIWAAKEITPAMQAWRETGRTKIVLQVDSEEHLMAIFQQAQTAGLETHLIQDAGKTEFGKPTYTCVAIGPNEVEKIDAITKTLKLW